MNYIVYGNLFNFPSRDLSIFMRCFISLDVDDRTTRENLVTVIDKLREFDGINTVDPGKLHLTLLFLGDIEEGNIDKIRENFVSVTNNVNIGTFTCSVVGLGTFPHMNYIQVVWAGAKPEEELGELHMTYTEGMNFTSEVGEKDFAPHITLGRVKHVNNREKSALQQLIHESDQEFGTFQATNVRLKQSVLTDDGPEYSDIAVCEL